MRQTRTYRVVKSWRGGPETAQRRAGPRVDKSVALLRIVALRVLLELREGVAGGGALWSAEERHRESCVLGNQLVGELYW